MRGKLNYFWSTFLSVIACVFLLSPHAGAQNSNHSLMLWCEAGYSAFFTKWDSFVTAGNFGSGAGFGYNILIRNHLIVSTGAEYLFLNSSIRPVDLIIHKNLTDTESDDYIMEYTLQKLSQYDKTHNIFVPVFIGFKTDKRKFDFYIQAGGKIGFMFASHYMSKIESYTTIGIYDRYIDPFREMPNHYFDTKKYRSTKPLNFNQLQAVVSLEMGFEIPSANAKNTIRVGFFADYGVLNRQTREITQQKNELIIYAQNPNDIVVNNLYETEYKRSVITNSFFAGVKITLLFDVTHRFSQQQCISKSFSSKKKK